MLISLVAYTRGESVKTVKYVSCTPSPGSVIDSWDYTLTFDITDAVNSLEEGAYGIGYIASGMRRSTILYKGMPDDGEQVAILYHPDLNGASEEFVVNANTLSFHLDDSIPIEAGQLYSLKISYRFGLYEKGDSRIYLGTSFVFDDSFVLTFYGADTSEEKLILRDTSLKYGAELESVSGMSFTFSEPVVINDSSLNPMLRDTTLGTDIIGGHAHVDPGDARVLNVSFDKDEPLYLGHSYTIELPRGMISKAADKDVTNDVIAMPLSGLTTIRMAISSTSPVHSEKGLFDKVTVAYDLPEDRTLFDSDKFDKGPYAYLYINEVSNGNKLASISGRIGNDGRSMVWDLTDVVLTPASRYILVETDDVSVYSESGIRCREYIIDDLELEFTTPGVDDCGLKPLEFGVPELGKHGASNAVKYTEGMEVSKIGNFEVALKDLYYIGDKMYYDLEMRSTPSVKGKIYLVDGDSEILDREFSMYLNKRKTAEGYEYYVARGDVYGALYEGKTYRIVFPAGRYFVRYKNFENFLPSPELSYTVKGSSPASLDVIACTLDENEEVESITNVAWSFSAPVKFAGDATTARLSRYQSNGRLLETVDCPMSIEGIWVKVDCTDSMGRNSQVFEGQTATVTIQAGVLAYTQDATIVNDEISVTVIGEERVITPPVKAPEYVEANVIINGFHKTTLEAVKDHELSVSLIPDDNWEVTSLMHDGEDVLASLQENEGVYTVPALTGDTRIEATVEYSGVTINEIPSAVVEIPETRIKVYSEGRHIIVDGINVGDVVTVYSTNGMKIAGERLVSPDSAMQITVANGQIYIVRVNDKAVRIQH